MQSRTTVETNMRNSNIELLRIICILMIVTMHVFGEFRDVSDPLFRNTSVFINAFCNSGVTIFVLISGYYGIRPNLGKWVSLATLTTFYAWIGLGAYKSGILPLPNNNLEIKEVVGYLVPVFCNKYWFITSYLMLMALSGYIQRLLDTLTRREFKHLIAILALFVIIAPTMFMLEIFKDSGKGFMNMLTAYLIGRYVSKYGFPDFIRKWHKLLIPGLTLVIFVLNEVMYKVGFPGLFARDNNLLIVALAISMFYYAISRRSANSRFINKFAGYVLPVYIVHLILLAPMCYYLSNHVDVHPLLMVVISISLLFIVSILIEGLRRSVLTRFFALVNNRLNAMVSKYVE